MISLGGYLVEWLRCHLRHLHLTLKCIIQVPALRLWCSFLLMHARKAAGHGSSTGTTQIEFWALGFSQTPSSLCFQNEVKTNKNILNIHLGANFFWSLHTVFCNTHFYECFEDPLGKIWRLKNSCLKI